MLISLRTLGRRIFSNKLGVVSNRIWDDRMTLVAVVSFPSFMEGDHACTLPYCWEVLRTKGSVEDLG